MISRIAVSRSVLALTRYQAGVMLEQSRRALPQLRPDNVTSRAFGRERT